MCQYELTEDTASVLEPLYQAYEEGRRESDLINRAFQKLEALHARLSFEEQTEAYRLCGQIADEQARLAFREGVRVGIRLARELGI